MDYQLFRSKVMHNSLEEDVQTWLRPILVVGVLAGSIYLGVRASERYLLLLLSVWAIPVLLRRPPLGLMAIIPASLIVPFSVSTGTGTSINATALLIGALIVLWWLDMFRRRDLRLLNSRPILPLLVFAGVVLISFVNGNRVFNAFAQTAPFPAQVGGAAIFLLSIGAFLLVGHQLGNERWLERLTWIFLGLAALYIAGHFLPPLGNLNGNIFQPGADGSLFWTWVIALAFSQAVFNKSLGKPWRLTLAILVLAAFYVGLYENRDWLSGWLPPAVAAMVILWIGAPRIGLLASFGGGVLAALKMFDATNLVMTADNQYSLLTRLEAWNILGEIVKASPILGLGPANYYWYTPLFSILGWQVKFNSHNNYIDIVAQTGLLGLVCFLWFAWEEGRLAWRLRATFSAGFSQAYVYGATGGLLGTLAAGLLGDWIIPFVYNIGLQGFRASVLAWLFLGGLLVLEHSSRPKLVERNDNCLQL